MTQNSFEKQIREKLSQTEINPSDGLLDAIFETRAANAKPFLGLGYTKFFIMAAVVAVTAGIWYFNADESKSTTQLASQNSQTQTPDNSTNSQANSDGNNNKNSSVEKPALVDNNGNSNEATASAVTPKSNTKGNNSSPSNSRIPRDKSQKQMASVNDVDAVKNNFVKPVANTRNNKPSKWNGENADVNAYFNVDAPNRPIIDHAIHNGNSHLFVYESVDPAVLANEGLRYSSTSNVQKLDHNFDFEAASMVEKSKNGLTLRGNHSYPLFVDVLYSPTFTKVSHAKDESFDFRSMNRNNINQQFGLRVSTPVFGKFTAFAGLNLLNLNTNYNGTFNYQEQGEVIRKNITYINDPIKGVITVVKYDTSVQTLNKSKNLDFKNTYSVFRMPIGLAYNFGIKKFDFAINASADLNLIAHSTVYTQLTETQTANYTTQSKFLNLGAGLSFMAAYQLSPKFKLIAEPGVSYMCLNADKTGFARTERVLNYTTSVGLRYSLF